MNRVLGSFHTSNQAMELQLFRKFISKQQVGSSVWPDVELTRRLKPVIDKLDVTRDKIHCGGLFIQIVSPFEQGAILEGNECSKLLLPIKEKGFQPVDVTLVDECFRTYIGNEYICTLILHK